MNLQDRPAALAAVVAVAVFGIATAAVLYSGGSTVTPEKPPDPSAQNNSSEPLIDGAELVETHEAVLANESFVAQVELVARSGNRTTYSLSQRTVIDRDSQQYLLADNRSLGSISTYTDAEAGTTYVRKSIPVGNETQVNVTAEQKPYENLTAVNPERAATADFLTNLLSNTTLTEETETTVNNQSVTVYRASGADKFSGGTLNLTANQSVSSFEFTMMVTDRGHVRYVSFSIGVTNEQNTREIVVSQTNSWQVMEVDVSEPNWTSNATVTDN